VEPKCNADIAPCLSVVMPVYNEEPTVIQVLERVLSQRPVQEVIVIDDGSSDNGWQKLEGFAQNESRVKLLRQPSNQGKGAALRRGFQEVKAEIVIVQDADLEYDPVDYHLLLNPILAGKADVVFGSRFVGAGAHRVLYFWHAVGNRLITLLSNVGTDLNCTDIETGFKTFRREVIQKITIEENRFGFEPEIVAKVARLGLRIFEVPISYYGRTYAEGKKVNWKDGVSALRCILKYNFFR
jgi:glycosyltransferase involved in cell wall biosynthesis